MLPAVPRPDVAGVGAVRGAARAARARARCGLRLRPQRRLRVRRVGRSGECGQQPGVRSADTRFAGPVLGQQLRELLRSSLLLGLVGDRARLAAPVRQPRACDLPRCERDPACARGRARFPLVVRARRGPARGSGGCAALRPASAACRERVLGHGAARAAVGGPGLRGTPVWPCAAGVGCAVLLFALALLAKPAAVAFAALVLVQEIGWRRRPWRYAMLSSYWPWLVLAACALLRHALVACRTRS